mgnify:CR=1 FL=1
MLILKGKQAFDRPAGTGCDEWRVFFQAAWYKARAAAGKGATSQIPPLLLRQGAASIPRPVAGGEEDDEGEVEAPGMGEAVVQQRQAMGPGGVGQQEGFGETALDALHRRGLTGKGGGVLGVVEAAVASATNRHMVKVTVLAALRPVPLKDSFLGWGAPSPAGPPSRAANT